MLPVAAARSDVDILVIEPDVTNPALEAVRLMRELRDAPAGRGRGRQPARRRCVA
jgi:hypothetical protein